MFKKIKRYLLPVALSLVGIAGCGDNKSTNGSGKKDGLERIACEETSYSEREMNGAFDVALKELAKDGYSIGSNIWEDEERFSLIIERMTESLGCTPEESARRHGRGCEQVTDLSKYQSSVRYCGTGAGEGETDFRDGCFPHAGDCFNEVCYIHDSCYDGLINSDKGGRICIWGEETSSCDDDFFSGYEECREQGVKGECGFWCGTYRAIARGMSEIERRVMDVSSESCLWGGREREGEREWNEVSAGDYHTCGVRTNGIVECWGSNTYGEASPPTGNFTQVSAGNSYTCGVRTNGTVEWWGDRVFGIDRSPTGNFTQVSAGDHHACVVRTNGTVECWGSDIYGRASPPTGNFTQVSAGGTHTCGVRTNGTVECWGDDEDGQASPPTGNFTQVSAGNLYTCGVRTNGTVECWGDDGRGQASPPTGNFTQVSAGNEHTCGVRTDGVVECWGDNKDGQASPP